MAKSKQTFNKLEKEKKRRKKREEKAKKKEERKENSNKGGGLDNMMAYVDEYGNISDTPPDPNVKKEKIDASSIEISVPKKEDVVETVRSGKVDYFNDEKGFGFIREDGTQEKYFYHVNNVLEEIRENDKVNFELERGPKGMNAIKVKKAS